MKRPDIEGYRRYIKEDCCGMANHPYPFCDSWGCSTVTKLLDYIEFLEGNASQSAVEADATCRCFFCDKRLDPNEVNFCASCSNVRHD